MQREPLMGQIVSIFWVMTGMQVARCDAQRRGDWAIVFPRTSKWAAPRP